MSTRSPRLECDEVFAEDTGSTSQRRVLAQNVAAKRRRPEGRGRSPSNPSLCMANYQSRGNQGPQFC